MSPFCISYAVFKKTTYFSLKAEPFINIHGWPLLLRKIPIHDGGNMKLRNFYHKIKNFYLNDHHESLYYFLNASSVLSYDPSFSEKIRCWILINIKHKIINQEFTLLKIFSNVSTFSTFDLKLILEHWDLVVMLARKILIHAV